MNVSPELKESRWNNSDVASGFKEAVKENKLSLWFCFTHNKRNYLLVTWGVRIDIWKEIFLSSDSYFIFVLAVCIQRLSFFNVYITFFFLLFCWLVVCTCGHREDGWNMGHDSWSCVLVRALWLAAVSVSCWVWSGGVDWLRRCAGDLQKLVSIADWDSRWYSTGGWGQWTGFDRDRRRLWTAESVC